MYVRMYVCMYVQMYIYTYIYIHIYIHMQIHTYDILIITKNICSSQILLTQPQRSHYHLTEWLISIRLRNLRSLRKPFDLILRWSPPLKRTEIATVSGHLYEEVATKLDAYESFALLSMKSLLLVILGLATDILVGGLEYLTYFSQLIGFLIIPTDFQIFQREGSPTSG